MRTPWREPAEESTDLYPNLCVHDGRAVGSITAGPTRLPLWAFCTEAVASGWTGVEASYSPMDITREDYTGFIYHLLQLRGEFGRLLLILADEERRERWDRPWWEVKRARKRVAKQLRLCLAVVEDE